jgi:hypothetical protein
MLAFNISNKWLVTTANGQPKENNQETQEREQDAAFLEDQT